MPTGKLLVYSNVGEDGGKYSLIDFPGLTVQPFEPLNSEQWFVDWSHVLSPDGRYIAYDRSVNQEYDHHTLYVLDIATGETNQIFDGYQSNGIPNWTADGRFLEFDNVTTGFYIYDVQTGDLSHSTVSSELVDASAISPSGDRIAYKGACPGYLIACPVDLYVVNTDGSNEKFLEQGAMDWIFWSADARLIYYSLFGDRETYGNSSGPADSGYRLYSLDLATGQSSTIEEPGSNTEAWGSSFLSPDGEFLTYVFGGSLKVIRTSDNSTIDFISWGHPAWTPDSRYVASNQATGDWLLYDVMTGESTIITPDLPLSLPTPVGWLP